MTKARKKYLKAWRNKNRAHLAKYMAEWRAKRKSERDLENLRMLERFSGGRFSAGDGTGEELVWVDERFVPPPDG